MSLSSQPKKERGVLDKAAGAARHRRAVQAHVRLVLVLVQLALLGCLASSRKMAKSVGGHSNNNGDMRGRDHDHHLEHVTTFPGSDTVQDE